MFAVALAIAAVLLASIAAVGLAGWLLVRAARARIEEQDRIAARVEETFSVRQASADSSAHASAAAPER